MDEKDLNKKDMEEEDLRKPYPDGKWGRDATPEEQAEFAKRGIRVFFFKKYPQSLGKPFPQSEKEEKGEGEK